ncbi:MAG: DUF1822 family protein [Richelia sp. RM2_1_2]|nr:DUF1822 family protein [Richelia sp. SM1_7_0]NJN10736.1 DUF1822 family protein [Richelia sp. RM1_1_1]NJO29137.1 DUF1822 family protein [Richelia sp. SL_2_1]NJO58157.1 DUF1822 family protein [Richelia sp. RM2_1_2]
MNHVSLFSFASPSELILEIPLKAQNQAWIESQNFSNSANCYQAYMNKLCLLAILPWLESEFTQQAKLAPSTTALPSLWELVNGCSITIIDGTKFILVPTEDIDLSELRVAQEWVDIPSWAGDYYLGVQVQPDEGFVRVWGYCTHAQLKNNLNYDATWRTYSLDSTEVITDLSLLTIALEFCPQETTRSEIEPLTNLTPAQGKNLISRLGNPEVITPRLEIPFSMWGTLIENDGWRRSLYERRLGLPEQWSVIEWLQNGVSQTAQQFGWGRFDLQTATSGTRSVEQSGTILARELTIAEQQYILSIVPQNEAEGIIWRFALRNAVTGNLIPEGFKLRLLTEDLESFPNNEDVAVTAVEQLVVEVILESGEGIIWEIEPIPENCDREILRF